jgi:hypothetical protein
MVKARTCLRPLGYAGARPASLGRSSRSKLSRRDLLKLGFYGYENREEKKEIAVLKEY